MRGTLLIGREADQMSRIWIVFWLLYMTWLAAAEELRLVQFSDIHAGGQHFSAQHFQLAVTAGLALQPQAVVLSGDHCDNSVSPETFGERYRDALKGWKVALDGYSGPILFTLGNDDLRHNYQSQPEDLLDAYRAGREVWGSDYYLDDLGNGVAPARPGGFRWISLNSQVFALYNQTAQADEQARRSLDWLHSELLASQGPLILLCHIPPAWDLYSHKPGWKPEHLQRLLSLLEEYPDQVVMLCGHYHRNHVQGMRRRDPVPVLSCGALATKYGYQPNWREYRWMIQPGKAIRRIDYLVHYPLQPNWLHYYRLIPSRLEEFRRQLLQPAFLEDYLQDVYGHWVRWVGSGGSPETARAVRDEFWLEDGLKRATSR